MCDKSPEKPEQHVAEKLADDESIVTQKDVQHAPSSIIYPKANLYYAFAEDTHPSTRIAVSKSLRIERGKPLVISRTKFLQHPCLEDAANRYLLSDPPSFVIFGKPGLNSVDFASAIADAWKCVLVSPSMLIQQEIDSGSEEGQRLKEILGNGERVPSNIVMDLIRRRMKMRDVGHRGYVAEGVPLIPNKSSLDRSHSEFDEDQSCDRTVSCNHWTDSTADPMKLPEKPTCKMLFNYEWEIPQQINEMFTEWPLKPSVIIYMACPKQDVVSLVMHQHMETATVDIVEDTLDDESNPSLNLHQDTKKQPIESDDQGNNYSGRISDVKQEIELQCDLYMRFALPMIDRWILTHDPQRVIRVNGRNSTQRILQVVNARLHMLRLQPSILPEQIKVEVGDLELFQNDEVDVKKKEKPGENEEKAFEILRQRGIVLAEFLWKLSAWKFYCPVKLAAGRRKIGCTKYAVRFLRNIFFLSSKEALDMFLENPRTFLLPINSRPTCKIAVIGPIYSGKSELSQRLAEIFGGTVINVNEILKEMPERCMYNDVTDKIHLSHTIEEEKQCIVQNIRKVLNEKLENELYRDGGYVVNGMPIEVMLQFSTKIKDVVILFEREPYKYLHSRFKKFHAHKKTNEIDYQNDTFVSKMDKYEHCIDSKWNTLEGVVVKCNLTDIKDVTEYVVNYLTHHYKTTTIAKEMETSEETTSTKDNTNSTGEETKEDKEEHSPRVVDLETAERLLDCGYYFLSPFGRRCLVQASTNETPIPIIHGPIFPVIHDTYIYFLGGEKAVSAFLKEPSKYMNEHFRLWALPLKIAVIGPPKCGKTTLAHRFAKTYGMKRITRDVALRHMLNYYSWTESARKAKDQLQAGQPASLESVAYAIETLSLGSRATSQGYVLDDCPSSREEAERLILSGVQPMIVLALKADLSFLLECHAQNNDNTKVSSSDFLTRYENWQVHEASFRDWLKRFSRNVVELNATKSKWNTWTIADHAVRSRFTEIMLYHQQADANKVHSLRYMCVSPFEFRERQSRYEFYCPVCLFLENTLLASRQPTDNDGMVQFEEYFYWICPPHMAAFVKNPQQYLPPINTASLPEERPQILEQVVDVGHACWARRLRFDGWCPVTFVDGPTDRRLTRGRADLAVLLSEEEVYLLCSEECRDKFLANHSMYRNVEIMSTHEIDPRCLSATDYLERTVAKEVVEAVKRVAAHRPKIVGLSPAASAAIHIGIHLKTHNASSDLDKTLVYVVADERMARRDKIIRIVTDNVKTTSNPYVAVDEEQEPQI